MGTIKVIITVQRVCEPPPDCHSARHFSPQRIIALDNLNHAGEREGKKKRNTLHTNLHAAELIAFQRVIVPQRQILIGC